MLTEQPLLETGYTDIGRPVTRNTFHARSGRGSAGWGLGLISTHPLCERPSVHSAPSTVRGPRKQGTRDWVAASSDIFLDIS